MGRLQAHSTMMSVCLVLLGGYCLLLHRRANNVQRQGSLYDIDGLQFLLAAEDEAQIEQVHRVNAALKHSQELMGQSAELSIEVQRLSGGLTRAVEYEIEHATKAQAQIAPAVNPGAARQQAQPRTQHQAQPQPQPQPHSVPQPAVPLEVHQWLKDCKQNEQRAQHIVNAMQHAWDSYVRYAWGQDELLPLSKKGKASFGGLGATIIDSLDTLHIMGLNSRFNQAKEFVLNLNFDRNYDASVFETTIRILGGLLSANDLTGDTLFLHKAEELADRLLHAFETPTGIPWNQLNLHTLRGQNPGWTAKMSTLAEFGTEQMEFFMLSAKTGKSVYRNKAEAPISLLHQRYPEKGLMPIYINPHTGQFGTEQVSFGALGDSYYEYLLKVWILFGKNDEMFRAMWVKAMDEMLERLIHKTTPSGFTYIAELSRSGGLVHKMDHLACFVPGMLALGVHHEAVSGAKGERYLQVAKDLTETCHQMYKRMPCGIAPEYIEARNGQDFVYNDRGSFNLQRPEAVEAFFILYRVTGNPKYQEYGWEVFSAFETFTKVDDGYTGIRDVRRTPPQRDDTMQSFWLAETLKYLYLLFSPPDKMSLDDWVLNTEAHPMKVRPWTGPEGRTPKQGENPTAQKAQR
mmetsp:Transcript_23810/g.66056  ORF Transcript_23810/g.66056 Transcript_23810/m.66056 type:complete len:630 (+) Transcript_23810:124-2013(+)